MTWNIKDICGTPRFLEQPTELGDLLQTIYWAENYLQWYQGNKLPFSDSNALSLVKQAIYNWRSEYGLEISPAISDDYVSSVTSESEDKMRHWRNIFDLNLHDSAFHYTMKAAESSGDEAKMYANIATTLWVYSRQLRVDRARESEKDLF